MAKRVSLKGKGADLFFGDYAPESPPGERPEPEIGDGDGDDPLVGNEVVDDGSTVRNGAEPTDDLTDGVALPIETMAPRSTPARMKARSQASKQASRNGDDVAAVEAIRKTVKTLGREVSFVRLTPEEKGALAEVVYAYKRQGIKTTENEINRIAINALLADYHANGETSLLARVLAALRA